MAVVTVMNPMAHGSYVDWLMAETFRAITKERRSIGDGAARLVRARIDETWPVPATGDFTIQVLTSGRLPVQCDWGAGRFSGTMRPGAIAVSAPDTALHNAGRGRCEFLIVALPGAALRASAERATGRPFDSFGRLHAQINQDRRLVCLLEWLWEEAEQGSPSGRFFADATLDLIVHRLLALAKTSPLPRHGALAPWQVERVMAYIEDTIAEDVSLEELATLLDLSTFHLCRAFKQSTGLPPHRWRLQRRLERAQQLLESTDLAVSEVAAAIGYNDPSQLAALFRKALGTSPTEYRRQRKR